MFGFRRKHEGFEWQQHVRTTLKEHRAHRKARALRRRRQMVTGVTGFFASIFKGLWVGSKAGVRALVSGSKIAAVKTFEGASMAGKLALNAAKAGAKSGARGGKRGLSLTWSQLSRSATRFARRCFVGTSWTPTRLGAITASVVLLGAALTAAWATGRLRSGLPYVSATMMWLAILVAVLLTGLAWAAGNPGRRRRSVAAVRALPARFRDNRRGSISVLAGLAGLAVVGVLGARAGLDRMPGLGFLSSGPSTLSGRALAVSGDTLRLKGTVVKLSGIEAPDREQQCQKSAKRTWPCGQAAADALAERLASASVRCDVDQRESAERVTGRCVIERATSRRAKTDADVAAKEAPKDLAAELVRAGFVFANAGWLSSYGSLEQAARAEKIGLWKGDAERPKDYRAKLWEAALKTAPQGCPIKGHVSGDDKIYMLPWSPDYARTRVRSSRGERWFCSEEEAQAAGFKPVARS